MIYESVIYEEEIESYETEIALERALNQSYFLINSLYFENTSDTNSEKFKNIISKIITAFKAFINKCREYLKSAISKLTGRVTDAYVEFKLKDLIIKFDDSIIKAEKAGMTTFKFIDMKALLKCLDDECSMYKKATKKFVHEYIKNGSPKDAENMLKKFNDISEKYDAKLKEILNETKEYSIREAKKVAWMLENCRSVRKGGFVNIADEYSSVCDEIEQLTINTFNSLNKYSEDTGYIQNAKTLQQIIHNSCIKLHVHSAECVTAILKHGIPLICKIDEIANTKQVDTGETDDEGRKIYTKKDTSSDSRKEIRDITKKISEHTSKLSSIQLKSIRKVSRKNDIKDWKFTKGESPLSFDNRPVTPTELKDATMQAKIKAGIEILSTYNDLKSNI